MQVVHSRYGIRVRLVSAAVLANWVLGALLLQFVSGASSEVNRRQSVEGVLALAIGTALLVIEFFGRQVTLTHQGIRSRSPWGRRVFIRWSEVEQITYRPLAQGLTVTDSHGRRIALSRYFDHLPELSNVFLQRVPTAVQPEARKALAQFIKFQDGSDISKGS